MRLLQLGRCSLSGTSRFVAINPIQKSLFRLPGLGSWSSKNCCHFNNSFLRYQLSAAIAGLVSPVSGEILADGVIGWPVGDEEDWIVSCALRMYQLSWDCL